MNPKIAQALADRAKALHAQGQLDAALPLYEMVARSFPDEAEPRRLLGVVCLDMGRCAEAAAHLAVSVALAPERGVLLANLGDALRGTGHPTALRWLRRAADAAPSRVDLRLNLGYSLLDSGAGAEAAEVLRTCLGARCDDWSLRLALADALAAAGRPETARAAVRTALALAPDAAFAAGAQSLRTGHVADAERLLRWAVRLAPADAEAALQLADARRRIGDGAGAERTARHALAFNPAHTAAWRVLAGVRLSMGDGAGARVGAVRAVRMQPVDAAAWAALGLVELRCVRLRAAERCLSAALAVEPQAPEACNNLGVVLLAGRHPERAQRSLARAHMLAGSAGAANSNLLLALNYDPSVSDDELAEAHRRWGVAAVAARRHRLPAAPRFAGGRLRVGYVSPDFRRHPVGYLSIGALEHHDRTRFEVHAFSDTRAADDLTARLRDAVEVWHDSAGWSDAALEESVRREGIDILVDLAGHTADNRLTVFAAKPAALQVSWLGYFHTTGLPTMDAVLTDGESVPAERCGWFTERVVPLSAGRFCYTPPQPSPPVAPPPLLDSGRPTFGSFNNLSKLSPPVLDLWSELLRRVPTARLVLKWHTLTEEAERQALHAAFAERGINAARLDLRGPARHDAMLEEYADVDVALDPFPFCGCLTTLEALWMGVPVVTLEGRRPVARQSLAILRQIGHGDLVAATAEDYLAMAARLVADPAALAARRFALRARMAERICDGAAFTAAFEAALLDLWSARR
ncbi:tetratricopeptide repeat protein [Azospirillum sp. sgz301742]